MAVDFWREDEVFDLGARHRPQIAATAAFDLVTRTLGAVLVGGLAGPLGFHPRALRHLEADGRHYSGFLRPGGATAFFSAPPARVRVHERPPSFLHFVPKGGECVDLFWESPYAPSLPRWQKRLAKEQKNRLGHARYWRHRRSGPRPTLIAVHGFSADLHLLNEWLFQIPWLYRLGCDVLLFTLPYHGRRQERGSPFSGHGFFAGGLPGINEALGQAVCDLRVLLDYLERERAPGPVGMTGISLGGYLTALMAALEPRLALAVPTVPLVSIVDAALEWRPIGDVVRLGLRWNGLGIDELRRMLAIHSPLTHPPVLGEERLMIIGGIADRLAPPKHSRVLWEHWQRCRMHWFPGSHLIHLDRGRFLREMARFMREVGFLRPR